MHASNLFWGVAPILACFGVALIPFKLSLSYIFLVPLIIGWIIFDSKQWINNFQKLPSYLKLFVAFLVSVAFTSLFGLSPAHSSEHLIGLFFYPLLIPLFWKLGVKDFNRITLSLVGGLTVACILNVLRDSTLALHTKFIGSVSQSGQLSLVLFLVGLLWVINYPTLKQPAEECSNCHFRTPILITGVSIISASILLVGWSSHWPAINSLAVIGLISFGVGIALIWFATKDRFYLLAPYVICLPVLVSTFIVNLKRGPWLGVISGLVLLAILTRKKHFLAPIGLALIVVFCVSPVRDRIFEAKDHFFISGGRSEIWQIGFELLLKYPLGIGFENSGYLREFSSTIPNNLKHFHSNLLNVAVETGWMGLALFIGVFYSFFKIFTSSIEKIPAAGWLAAGIASWFCAGLFEYNFGDSAVCNLLYLFIGLGLSLIATYPSFQSQN